MVLPSITSSGWSCFFQYCEGYGAAWFPPPLGGVAFPISLGAAFLPLPLRSGACLLLGGAAWSTPSFWEVLPVWWCCLPSSPFAKWCLSPVGWCCLVYSFLLGGVACLVVLPSFSSFGWGCFFPSSVGWYCLVSSFYVWCCFTPLLWRGAAFLSLHCVGCVLPLFFCVVLLSLPFLWEWCFSHLFGRVMLLGLLLLWAVLHTPASQRTTTASNPGCGQLWPYHLWPKPSLAKVWPNHLWAKPSLAPGLDKTKFGQTNFGQPNIFGQIDQNYILGQFLCLAKIGIARTPSPSHNPSLPRTPPPDPGLQTTVRKLQSRTFQGPRASNTTKIPRADPQEREERKNVAGEGKKREILGLPPFGAPFFGFALPSPLRGPTLRGLMFLGSGLLSPSGPRPGPPPTRTGTPPDLKN